MHNSAFNQKVKVINKCIVQQTTAEIKAVNLSKFFLLNWMNKLLDQSGHELIGLFQLGPHGHKPAIQSPPDPPAHTMIKARTHGAVWSISQ